METALFMATVAVGFLLAMAIQRWIWPGIKGRRKPVCLTCGDRVQSVDWHRGPVSCCQYHAMSLAMIVLQSKLEGIFLPPIHLRFQRGTFQPPNPQDLPYCATCSHLLPEGLSTSLRPITAPPSKVAVCTAEGAIEEATSILSRSDTREPGNGRAGTR